MRTQVDIKVTQNPIKYQDSIFSMGSCFSVEMSNKLKKLKYNVLCNPSGITFNAISLFNTIKRVFSSHSLPEDELILNNNLWSHYDFHGSYNHTDSQTFINNVLNNLSKAKTHLSSSNFIVLTLGTAYTFKNKKTGDIVNNCHKMPGQLFERELLTTAQIFEALSGIKKTIEDNNNNNPQFILTLSPIRHIRDGLIENQRSKAHCLSAIHDFVNSNEKVSYFPSYEIMLDDLRDYRFYNRDMIHPSPLALDYIFDEFEKKCLCSNEQELRNRISKINMGLDHRPLNPESQQHIDFINKLNNEMKSLEQEYPELKF